MPLIYGEYILSLQDDIQSTTAESPPSFKPPPPPRVHRHQGKQLQKCPSSESSHSGLYFTASSSQNHCREPGHHPASPSLHQKRELPRDPSRDYAAVKKRGPAVPSRKELIKISHLSAVTQQHIGPFPRAQSPNRGPKTSAPSPLPPPPPPLPAPPPPPTSLPLQPTAMSKTSIPLPPGSKQQFVTVEVHRPNAEPDVNEVRPLPQARGEKVKLSLLPINQLHCLYPNPKASVSLRFFDGFVLNVLKLAVCKNCQHHSLRKSNVLATARTACTVHVAHAPF